MPELSNRELYRLTGRIDLVFDVEKSREVDTGRQITSPQPTPEYLSRSYRRRES